MNDNVLSFIVALIIIILFIGLPICLMVKHDNKMNELYCDGLTYSPIGEGYYNCCKYKVVEKENAFGETYLKREKVCIKGEKENCTRTEMNYCAIECYENDRLIPCENFSSDEHFCNKGICEASGGCPDYFEELEGKTISDCMYELIGEKENE